MSATYKDHNGKHFHTFSSMCYWHGKNPKTVRAQLKRGLTLQEALTHEGHDGYIQGKDHEGTIFSSWAAMARHWKQIPSVFYKRIDRGWTIKRALTVARRARRIKQNAKENAEQTTQQNRQS